MPQTIKAGSGHSVLMNTVTWKQLGTGTLSPQVYAISAWVTAPRSVSTWVGGVMILVMMTTTGVAAKALCLTAGMAHTIPTRIVVQTAAFLKATPISA